jgi:hypothetical protein
MFWRIGNLLPLPEIKPRFVNHLAAIFLPRMSATKRPYVPDFIELCFTYIEDKGVVLPTLGKKDFLISGFG